MQNFTSLEKTAMPLEKGQRSAAANHGDDRAPGAGPAGAQQLSKVVLREFRAGDAARFRELNEAWIVRWFFLEPQDVAELQDPENLIVARGGHILVAVLQEQVVGCCALIPMGNGTWKLARMAVEENLRGLGIGRMLLQYAIAKARELRALRVTLETSTKLPNAIHLYESVGFRHTAAEADGHVALRADVFMQLLLGYG